MDRYRAILTPTTGEKAEQGFFVDRDAAVKWGRKVIAFWHPGLTKKRWDEMAGKPRRPEVKIYEIREELVEVVGPVEVAGPVAGPGPGPVEEGVTK